MRLPDGLRRAQRLSAERLEPGAELFPGGERRAFAVGIAVVGEEGVPCPGVGDDPELLPVAFQGGAEFGDVVEVRVLVLLAEDAEQGTGETIDALDRDLGMSLVDGCGTSGRATTPAVDGAVDSPRLRRQEEDEPAAHAEADGTDVAVALRMAAQPPGESLQVGDRLAIVECGHAGDDLLEVVGHPPEPMEEVGSGSEHSPGSEPPADVLDVGVEPEGLVDDDDRREAVVPLPRGGDVDGEEALGGAGERDPLLDQGRAVGDLTRHGHGGQPRYQTPGRRGGAPGAGSIPAMPEATPVERVLVVVAHPDDVDFGSAGTIATWTDQGISVSYCVVTDGDAGGFDENISRAEMARIRRAEQTAAAEVVGVHDIHWLHYPDGRLQVSLELRRDITRVIRIVRPQRVLLQSPVRNFRRIFASHPDHLAAGEAALCAVYPDSRNPFAHPELLEEEHLEPWTVSEVWMMAASDPDIAVDITDVFPRKVAALRKHVSQVGHRDDLEEMLRNWAAENAREMGLGDGRLAEVFRLVPTV